jgi:hypothetical protein
MVKRRFDYIFQPVAIDARIPPLAISLPARTGTETIRLLFEALDSRAIDMLSKSLATGVFVGDEVPI